MIVTEFQGRVGGSTLGPGGGVVDVRMTYNPEYDPMAVIVEFTEDGQGGVPWVMGRELLIRGATSQQPYGHGDVKLRRAGGVVIVCLESPDGHADVLLPYTALTAFLSATTEAVPVGEEPVDSELDKFLEEVLGS